MSLYIDACEIFFQRPDFSDISLLNKLIYPSLYKNRRWPGNRQIQMLRQDFVTRTDQQCKVNDVLQLPGIARPTVPFQDLLRLLADQWHRQVQALAVDAEEVLRQREDIPHPLA